MQDKASFAQNLESIAPIINPEKRYWFVRTNAGEYFDEFIEKEFIAIGYNDITLFDIKEATQKGVQGRKDIIEKIKKSHKYNNRRSSLAASQLIRFVNEIKKGDIIIIPSGFVA